MRFFCRNKEKEYLEGILLDANDHYVEVKLTTPVEGGTSIYPLPHPHCSLQETMTVAGKGLCTLFEEWKAGHPEFDDEDYRKYSLELYNETHRE